MVRQPRSLASLLRRFLQRVVRRPVQPYRRQPRSYLMFESLETRITPATFFQPTASTLQIVLTNNQESLTLSAGSSSITVVDSVAPTLDASVTAGNVTVSGNTATITAAGIAAYTGGVTIQDLNPNTHGSVANATVTFADSGANAYTIPMTVALTAGNSGDIVFTGANTFSNVGLTAQTAGGTIISTTGSSLALQEPAATPRAT
jgi:hypothetical protein